jgi:nicotinamide-nucleotide amidase
LQEKGLSIFYDKINSQLYIPSSCFHNHSETAQERMSFMNQEQHVLAGRIAYIVTACKETVAVCESSAGGLVSACLLSVPGASAFFVGGGVLYSYAIRKTLANMGREEHARYGGSTPGLILDMAWNFNKQIGATWVIGEGGAAGPAKSPYGHNAGYTALAVAGPLCRTQVIETGDRDRVQNMVEFATGLLRLFLNVLEEHHPDVR